MTEKSESNEWYLPKSLFIKYCKLVNLRPKPDVAATKKYHLCEYYFTEEDDALKQEWLIKAGTKKTGIWVNPPLKRMMTKKFVNKACQQWIKHNLNILMIIPTGVISRKYFRNIWKLFKRGYFVDIIPIDRPHFIHNGEIGDQARNDYILLVFRKRYI
ncbi:MAG: hypothetical protein GWN01_01410 [Nitrosopumilaceae archaeon]|nr:hypothetical protein [Nitrosopumilaceae archaeon]NIU86016.1 hypothetical protein [Nitrosopumilaceae archaeon]NIX60235.1 hypothetical protein [Nitrosopumilaceae archaeon]